MSNSSKAVITKYRKVTQARLAARKASVLRVLTVNANGVAHNARRIFDLLNTPQSERKIFERDLVRMSELGWIKRFIDADESKGMRNSIYMAHSKFNQPLATQFGQGV